MAEVRPSQPVAQTSSMSSIQMLPGASETYRQTATKRSAGPSQEGRFLGLGARELDRIQRMQALRRASVSHQAGAALEANAMETRRNAGVGS